MPAHLNEMYALPEYTHVCTCTDRLPTLTKPGHPASSSDSLRTIDEALLPSRLPPLTRDPLMSLETSSPAALNGPALFSALKKFPGGEDSLGVHEPGKVLAKAAGDQDPGGCRVTSKLSCPFSQTRPPSVSQAPTSPPTSLSEESPGGALLELGPGAISSSQVDGWPLEVRCREPF